MPIEYSKEGSIAVITINFPDILNALNPKTLIELSEVVTDFNHDPELRTGIITGAGEKSFCAGMDIKSVEPDGRGNADARPEGTLVRGLEIGKPLIAAVNGYALGGGLEIALACDIRIASENAVFGLPEVSLGIIPGWGGTQRLFRLIPFGKAMELILTGSVIDAGEALNVHLVSKVVSGNSLMTEAKELARRLSGFSPLALKAVKEALYRGYDMTLSEGLKLESRLSAGTMASDEFVRSRASFLEKKAEKTGETDLNKWREKC